MPKIIHKPSVSGHAAANTLAERYGDRFHNAVAAHCHDPIRYPPGRRSALRVLPMQPLSTTAHAADKAPSYLPLFEQLGGLDFTRNGSAEALTECYWCSKPKLHVNADTGQYHCKSGGCGKQGNHWTFLRLSMTGG